MGLLLEDLDKDQKTKGFKRSPELTQAFFTPFYLRKWEVTNGEYKTFLAEVQQQ